MLPGKKYSVDDIARILRKRVWMLLLPVAIGAAGAAVWARGLPDQYWAGTVILVVPQRISESIVQPTITSSITERLPSIRQAILSRPGLEKLIVEFDLYSAERQRLVMEDVVGIMRDHISTEITGRNDAFEVGYSGRDPVKVMQVAERLGSLFIDQSLSYRHDLSEDTDEFLESQLAETRRLLDENQERLAEYKRTYSGQLPSQVTSNLQQVETANGQVLAAQNLIGRNMERRTVFENRIADLETPGAPPPVAAGTDRAAPAGSTLQQLTAAQQTVVNLEARGLRPGHPDLEGARRQMRDLEQKWTAESKLSTPGDPQPVSAADAARLARLRDTRTELAELDRQTARAREDERDARAAVAAAQARLATLPARESEMVALMRDYDILDGSYRELLKKRTDSKISTNLERRQVGEQFSIIEPARLPERPFSPVREQMYVMGFVGGLALGLALVGLLEYRDRTFRTDEELGTVLGVPVLAVVPLMQSPQERSREVRRRVAAGITCASIVLGCVAIFVYAVAG